MTRNRVTKICNMNSLATEAEELDLGIDRQTIAFRELLKDSGKDSSSHSVYHRTMWYDGCY